jgi:hypothetical protein
MRCGEPVARAGDRIEVEGQHRHTKMNPHGFLFRIGCFRRAPGCLDPEAASTFWSWFEGYAWRAASCRGCAEHLGWSFTGSGGRFFGLIIDRLSEEQP